MMINDTKQPRYKLATVLCVCMALTGCKEVLYSDLTESDANEMATILEASNISASRKRDKKGVYELWIEGDNVAAANTILKSQGLPRKKYKSMDQLFAAEGLVGSPFEERVRYMFALEEKLTENLVSIHGVRDARVTVSIPEKSRYADKDVPSSASVILHYEEHLVVEDAIPKIKTLMASAVQGLAYENVAVVVFPTSGTTIAQIQNTTPALGAAEASVINDASSLFRIQTANIMQTPLQFIIISLLFVLIPLLILRSLIRRLGVRWSK